MIDLTKNLPRTLLILCLATAVALSACLPVDTAPVPESIETIEAQTPEPVVSPTPLPTREKFSPGELVDYTAQTGDTLPALAVRFNTTVNEILEANPIIPKDATTMPPGMPMKIPIYYLPLWGTPFQTIPDGHFPNGPSVVNFDTTGFVASQPGWLKTYTEYAAGANRSAAQIIDYVALNFSVSPRVLLALLEYQTGALTEPVQSGGPYYLGKRGYLHRGLYLQLVWAANILNNGYYGWRTGNLTFFDLLDGRLERPDPWQNSATVALQYYYSLLFKGEEYTRATGPEGFAQAYMNFFGDPWVDPQAHIPGSLVQPQLRLPFEPGKTWAYTGGPHTGWGEGEPFAGIDFAPPSVVGGCVESDEWSVAMADGTVVRTDVGIVVIDLDGDNDERTGWVLFYLHIATEGRVPLGKTVQAGEPIGHPSCEGGRTTGSHVHIARKYNGEWIPADGPLAFNLDGWVAKNGSQPYLGTLVNGSRTVRACECSDAASHVRADK